MNRHLVVVELDARLFDNPGETAGYIERAVALALQRDAIARDITGVDLRPAVTCVADDGPIRFIDGQGLDVSHDNEWDAHHLGIQTNGTLIEELSHRAELGDTDRGLDHRPNVSI